MKKSIITVLFIGVMGILSVSAQEKSKPDFKKLAAKAQASVDAELKLNSATNALSTAKGDTLIVGDSAKFVVIKGMMFPVVAFTQPRTIYNDGYGLAAPATVPILDTLTNYKSFDPRELSTNSWTLDSGKTENYLKGKPLINKSNNQKKP